MCDNFYRVYVIDFIYLFYSSLILDFEYFALINSLGTKIKKFKWTYGTNLSE